MSCTKCVSPTSKKRRKSCSFTSFHLDPICHHSTWILYIIICAYSTRTLTTLVQNLNQFSRIQYRGTAPPPKKKRCRQVLQIWHEKGKWTMATLPASQQRQSLPATAALPLAHQPVRKLLETPQLSVANFTCSSLHGLWKKKTSWTVRKQKSDTTTINTYHIQDLKNQKSQYFAVNIKIQCTHIKFKTSFVKYTSNISPCTPPCARGPKCFRPTTSGFFFCWTLRLCDVLLANDLLGLPAPHPAVETSLMFRWDMRPTKRDAGFCRVLFFPKKIGGKQ